MGTYKCRMCGKEIEAGKKVVECPECKTLQAFPFPKSEQLEELYAKAVDHYQNSKFEQAASLFDHIASKDPSDTAIHWHLVLCKYGIQYVYEPKRNRYEPTLFSPSFLPIANDEHYKLALQYATSEQRELFQAEANIIRDVQTKIATIEIKQCVKSTRGRMRRRQLNAKAFDDMAMKIKSELIVIAKPRSFATIC